MRRASDERSARVPAPPPVVFEKYRPGAPPLAVEFDIPLRHPPSRDHDRFPIYVAREVRR